jgi:glycosyltransferase involved in cell wall biosynthesis
MPVVSVVTVVRNGAPVIEATLRSVLAQDYPAIDYVVIDGLSTDGTIDIVRKRLDRISIFRSERDAGIYDAMNKGAGLATGDWIIFMNAGDVFHAPTTLSSLLPHLIGNADVICGTSEKVLVDDLGSRRFLHRPGPARRLWKQMPTTHQATLVRMPLQRTYGFDTSYTWCADHDLLARLYRNGKRFVTVDDVICVFDCAGGQARDSAIYISERWRLSRGLMPFRIRAPYYFREWMHYALWGPVVRCVRPCLPRASRQALRRIRGTAGT